jgi:hypothetical protein
MLCAVIIHTFVFVLKNCIFLPAQAVKACRGSKSIPPLIHNFDTILKRVVNLTLLPLSFLKKSRWPLRSWVGLEILEEEKNLFCWQKQKSTFPARSSVTIQSTVHVCMYVCMCVCVCTYVSLNVCVYV